MLKASFAVCEVSLQLSSVRRSVCIDVPNFLRSANWRASETSPHHCYRSWLNQGHPFEQQSKCSNVFPFFKTDVGLGARKWACKKWWRIFFGCQWSFHDGAGDLILQAPTICEVHTHNNSHVNCCNSYFSLLLTTFDPGDGEEQIQPLRGNNASNLYFLLSPSLLVFVSCNVIKARMLWSLAAWKRRTLVDVDWGLCCGCVFALRRLFAFRRWEQGKIARNFLESLLPSFYQWTCV